MNKKSKNEKLNLRKIVGVPKGCAETNEFNSTTPLDYNIRLRDIGFSRKLIREALKELEDVFDIKISGVDREEIITVGDLVTAVYLQTR